MKKKNKEKFDKVDEALNELNDAFVDLCVTIFNGLVNLNIMVEDKLNKLKKENII